MEIGSDTLTINSGTRAVNFAGPIGSANGLGGITVNSSDGAVIFGTLDDANDRGTTKYRRRIW